MVNSSRDMVRSCLCSGDTRGHPFRCKSNGRSTQFSCLSDTTVDRKGLSTLPDDIALAIVGSTATFVAIIEIIVRLDKLVNNNPKPFSLKSSQPLNEIYTKAYEINLTRTTLVICDNPTLQRTSKHNTSLTSRSSRTQSIIHGMQLSVSNTQPSHNKTHRLKIPNASSNSPFNRDVIRNWWGSMYNLLLLPWKNYLINFDAYLF